MKFRKSVVATAFACALTITGCSTPQSLTVNRTDVEWPASGDTVQAELGDTLVQYLYSVTSPSFRIVSGSQVPPALMGSILQPLGHNEHFEWYAPNYCRRIETGEWSVMDGFGGCDSLGFAIFTFEDWVTEPADWVDVNRASVDQRFIYNGRVGSFIKFTYREFTGTGYSRDAFTQDVQYDLEQGRVIGFKGARLEVIEASNRSITYKLLNHFDRS